MDKEILTKELLLELGDSSNISLKELESKISNVLALYAVSKSKTTLPSCGDGSTTKFLFEQFAKDKISEGKSKRTLEQYFLAISKLYAFVQKDIHLCSKDDIVSYLNYYRYSSNGRELKPNTITNRYLQISAFFTWLFNNSYIAKNPFDLMCTPKSEIPVKSIITNGEFERIIICCEKHFKGVKKARAMALVTFMIETGMRVNELVNIKIKNIDWKKRSALIECGKGGKPRLVFFGEKSEIRLKDYLALRNHLDADDYLFASLNVMENKITKDTVQADIREIGEITGLKKLHPHLFRTTFATTMVSKGVPIPTVSKILGHSSPQTLTSYLVITEDDMQAAVRKCS